MEKVGKVDSLWRYPVKSMRGEQLEEAFVGFPGVYGDRIYAFRSSAAPKGFPWFTAREQPAMLSYRPHFRDHAHTMKPYNLPEAEAVGSGLTPVYGDAESFTVDVESPGGERLSIHDPRLMSMLREGIHEKHELTLLRSDRAMTDCRPISIMSLQTVQQLSNEIGITVHKRQFRANVYVDLESGNGFKEDEFVGRTLRLGRRASIAVLKRDSRCKICTLDFQTTRPNPELMKQLARDHEGQAGIYGAVLIEGLIRAGDEIALQD